MLDDRCVSDGGMWCVAANAWSTSTGQACLIGMLVCIILAVFLVARVVLRAAHSFGESRRSDVPSPLAAKLKEMRARADKVE